MVSLTDFLSFAAPFWVAAGVWAGVRSRHGAAWGWAAAMAAFLVAAWLVLWLRGVLRRRNERRRLLLRERYRHIYRVLALPEEALKAEGAEVRVGDYGWEAEPLRADGRISLQGLTAGWTVVWHAGFRPEQVEQVAVKPRSQYDWDAAWLRNPPPCDYPVIERRTRSMGFPV